MVIMSRRWTIIEQLFFACKEQELDFPFLSCLFTLILFHTTLAHQTCIARLSVMYFSQVDRDQECTVFFPFPPLPSAVPLCPSGPLRTFSRSVKVNSTTVQVQSKQHHCCGAFSVIRSSLHDLCMIGSPQN